MANTCGSGGGSFRTLLKNFDAQVHAHGVRRQLSQRQAPWQVSRQAYDVALHATARSPRPGVEHGTLHRNPASLAVALALAVQIIPARR